MPGPSQVVYKRFVAAIIRNYDPPGGPPLLRDARSQGFAESGRRAPISFHLWPPETLLSSMDSDLEAFSHNPTDGSFTALPFQATVFTNYLNLLFLSY